MSINTSDEFIQSVKKMFCLMDHRRHLPGYPLERRAAPFFELFLHDIVGTRVGVPINPVVMPEFPLRMGTLFCENELQKKNRKFHPNQSLKVDYVALSLDVKKVFLIELKTDMKSVDQQQKADLRAASKIPFGNFVDGVKCICKVTKQKSKYVHLLHRLSELDLVSIRDEDCFHQLTCRNPKTGWNSAMDRVQLTDVANGLKCERVVYIQPCRSCEDDNGIKYIDFKEVAEEVKGRGEIGRVFAKYLCRWRNNAGENGPRIEDDCW